MGAKDRFNRRAAKRGGRKKATRERYDKVLIVCEGSKTEPMYFDQLIDEYELSTANVIVDGTSGSNPRSVYEHAVKLFDTEKNTEEPYDRVYCVFDKDDHSHTNSTLNSIQQKKSFYVAYSVPCFEYWLLLHFENRTRPYVTQRKLTSGQQVEKDLICYLPNYKKADKTIFQQLLPHLEKAKCHAAQTLKAAKNNGTDNPSTTVHELIEYLQKIKS